MTIYRAKAPMRVSFAGGGTDLESYFREYGGAVLCAGISKHSRSMLAPTQTGASVVKNKDLKQVLNLSAANSDERRDLIQTALKRFRPPGSFELTLRGDVPPGSGLGSSSSLTVSLLALMRKWVGEEATVQELVKEAYQVERVDFGIAGGWQDQIAAAYGGMLFIEFYRDGTHTVERLALPPDFLRELESRLVLVHTGQTRLSGSIIVQQEEATKRQENLSALHEARSLAAEMKRAFCNENLDAVGPLLNRGWEAKKRYTSAISNQDIDLLYKTAISAGATGGKLLGAGGGGHMLFYVPVQRYDVEEAVTKVGGRVIDFTFATNGVEAWSTE